MKDCKFQIISTLAVLTLFLSIFFSYSVFDWHETIEFHKNTESNINNEIYMPIWKKVLIESYCYLLVCFLLSLTFWWKWNKLRKKIQPNIKTIIWNISISAALSIFLLLMLFVITFPEIPVGEG